MSFNGGYSIGKWSSTPTPGILYLIMQFKLIFCGFRSLFYAYLSRLEDGVSTLGKMDFELLDIASEYLEMDSEYLGMGCVYMGMNSGYLEMDSGYLEMDSTHLEMDSIHLEMYSRHLELYYRHLKLYYIHIRWVLDILRDAL